MAAQAINRIENGLRSAMMATRPIAVIWLRSVGTGAPEISR